ncbi:MAG: Abi-alpha family protein [Gaiellaceae bacterium]
MADPDSTELIKAAAEGGVEGFVRTVFGPIVESGEWVGDYVRRQRMKTQIKTLAMARQMLDEAGLEARAVPARVLVPLLELAGLEDDPVVEEAEFLEIQPTDEPREHNGERDMLTRWAALIANAAGVSTELPTVLPSFASMLSELTPREAKMLDWLAGLRKPVWGPDYLPGADIDSIMEQAGYSWPEHGGDRRQYEVLVDNLERLRLVAVDRNEALTQLRREVMGGPAIHRTMVQLTALGAAFVDACAPPSAERRQLES